MAVATLNNFFGVFCIGFGLAMVFYGKRIIEWVYRLIVFTVFFGLTFGLAYNVMTMTLGVQIGVACGCALVAGVLTYVLDWIQKKFGIALLVGMCGIYGGMFLATVAGQEKIVKYIIVMVCGVIGFVIGMYTKLTILCTLTAACGAGMLMYGISLEAGGFSATTWSLYAYLVGGVVLAITGAVLQRYWFRDDGKKQAKDEDNDGVNDHDVMDDDEGRICGCF